MGGATSNPSILFGVAIDLGIIGEVVFGKMELLIIAASEDGWGCNPNRNADEKRAVG